MLKGELFMANSHTDTIPVNQRAIIQTGLILLTALFFGVFLPILFGTGGRGCRAASEVPKAAASAVPQIQVVSGFRD